MWLARGRATELEHTSTHIHILVHRMDDVNKGDQSLSIVERDERDV